MDVPPLTAVGNPTPTYLEGIRIYSIFIMFFLVIGYWSPDKRQAQLVVLLWLWLTWELGRAGSMSHGNSCPFERQL